MRIRTEVAEPAVALIKLSYRSCKAFLSFSVPMLDPSTFTLAHSSSDPSVVVILVFATVFKASKITAPSVAKSSVS